VSIGRYSRDAEHFVVVTPFEWNGRDFREGEVFPWRELGLVEYQRRTLWVANKIGVAEAPAAPVPEPEPVPAPASPAPPPPLAERPRRARAGV